MAVDFEEIDDYLGDYDESSVTISQRTLVPVIALAYDALARYGYSSEELATYLFELLTTVRLTTEEQRELEEELAEIVGYSATPDDEQVGLLSTLIQLNCPDAVADKTQDEWENRALHLLRSFGDYADD